MKAMLDPKSGSLKTPDLVHEAQFCWGAVKFAQRVLEINTQSMDELRRVLFQGVRTVRITSIVAILGIALFILVGYLYERRHSLEISAYGGVATPAPNLAIVFLITTLASIGLPMLNNFVGEYLVLQGTASANFGWAVFAALGVIFSACYMLWLYQRTFFGKASESLSHHMPDLTMREWAAIVPLVILMVWMGSFAQSFLPSISVQNAAILEQTKKLRVERVAIPARQTAEVSRANR